jgi:hypothetical protein
MNKSDEGIKSTIFKQNLKKQFIFILKKNLKNLNSNKTISSPAPIKMVYMYIITKKI